MICRHEFQEGPEIIAELDRNQIFRPPDACAVVEMDDENRNQTKPEELVAEDVTDDFSLFGQKHPREFNRRIRKMFMR